MHQRRHSTDSSTMGNMHDVIVVQWNFHDVGPLLGEWYIDDVIAGQLYKHDVTARYWYWYVHYAISHLDTNSTSIIHAICSVHRKWRSYMRWCDVNELRWCDVNELHCMFAARAHAFVGVLNLENCSRKS